MSKEDKEEQQGLFGFTSNDISFVRNKNIITFEYQLPNEIDDIYINDLQIFSDLMKYAII
tara:strand:+ start:181 stop:360 length:180 start_codon:yes stop_codon:yes gene_type:complete